MLHASPHLQAMAARPLYSSMAFKGNDVGDGDNDSQDDLMWNDEGSSQASSPRLETDAGHQAPSPSQTLPLSLHAHFSDHLV